MRRRFRSRRDISKRTFATRTAVVCLKAQDVLPSHVAHEIYKKAKFPTEYNEI